MEKPTTPAVRVYQRHACMWDSAMGVYEGHRRGLQAEASFHYNIGSKTRKHTCCGQHYSHLLAICVMWCPYMFINVAWIARKHGRSQYGHAALYVIRLRAAARLDAQKGRRPLAQHIHQRAPRRLYNSISRSGCGSAVNYIIT